MSLVLGHFVNDADYQVSVGPRGMQVVCPYYQAWKNMIARCTNGGHVPKLACYHDVTCSAEWEHFSNFKEWMESQQWLGLCLDKDILVSGNKVYSRNTCAFVPSYINILLTDRAALRGDYPLGVSYKRGRAGSPELPNPYAATLGKKYLSLHLTPEQAHKAWQLAKADKIIASVVVYKEDPRFILQVGEKLLDRAHQLREDAHNSKITVKL